MAESLQSFGIQSSFNGSQIFIGQYKSVLEMGSSSHWGLIMAPGQEANGDELGDVFLIFYKIIVCWVYH